MKGGFTGAIKTDFTGVEFRAWRRALTLNFPHLSWTLRMDYSPGIVDISNAERRVWLVKVYLI